jgi:hypothetical protein
VISMMQGIGWQDIFDILFIMLFDMMYFAVDPVGKSSLSPLPCNSYRVSCMCLLYSLYRGQRSGCFPGWIRDG